MSHPGLVPFGVRAPLPGSTPHRGPAVHALVGMVLAFVLVLLSSFSAAAQEVLPVPPLTARVIDQTGTLDDTQRAALEAQLEALEKRTGAQLVVLLVPTTQPEDIASYAFRVADNWKIGRRDVGDGVLLIVAKNDRTVRIEVARTLEGAIPDLAAKRIIDEAITPAFRQGDFAGGLRAGVEQIGKLVSGEALPPPKAGDGGRGMTLPGGFELLVFGLFALPIAAALMRQVLGRKFGSLATGAGVGGLAFVLSTSLWIALAAGVVALVYALFAGIALPGGGLGRRGGRHYGGFGGLGGGGGSWGGGGGGFSSGGGGSFGGGGASGRW